MSICTASKSHHGCRWLCGIAQHIIPPRSRRRARGWQGPVLPLPPRHGAPARPWEYGRALSAGFGLAAPQSLPWPSAAPTRSGGARISLSTLEDPLMLRLCHQMVTARGHCCAEPGWDAEVRDAAESSTLPGAGDGFPRFLPFANTFPYKGPRTCVPLMQSSRNSPPGNSSGVSPSPFHHEGATP